jgi:hypothetical protein
LLRAGDELLFARFSGDSGDEPVLAYEAEVRAVLAGPGPLRAPPVLARGRSWLLERGVAAEPLRGREAIEVVVRAAAELAGARLPERPWPARRERRTTALARRARLAASPLPLRDLAHGRRILASSPLPPVTSHGDFHTGNILFSEGVPWIVDWELADRRPAGFDLMTLWPTLDDAGDRERLWRAALDLVGEANSRELARLRYALCVRVIAGKLAPRHGFNSDPQGARRLLELLPELRHEAG